MLHQLYIRNYAIIDELRINFTGSLNIITGETGAGKSILMGALGLILGDRADTSTLLDKKNKCIVEAQFHIDLSVIRNFLLENDLDEEPELIVRREISTTGRSRAFVNDTPVNLTQLKDLSGLLVDLHRQFDTQYLNNRTFQLDVLDALCTHEKTLNDFHAAFTEYKSVEKKLKELRAEQEAANQEFDYHQFLYNELEQADFSENEIENLEQELKLMSNAESIKETLTASAAAFNEGEAPLLPELKAIITRLNNVKDLVPALGTVTDRLQSAYIELKDIADEIEAINEGVDYSEVRMNEMNERMNTAYVLLKKHHVQSTQELLAIKDDVATKLEKVADLSLETERVEKQEKEKYGTVIRLAQTLSAHRQKQIPSLTKNVNHLLKIVGMPNAAFKVDLAKNEAPGEKGIDTVEFLFNANKTSFQPLRKVASGGELSRLMLIIKSLVAERINLPTLIFDEIDTGISGEAARQIGIIIQQLSQGHQIILITHQPQIAARAHTHFFVYKEEKDGKVLTGIRILNNEERVNAIATMLSGDKPSAAAYENARELMK